MKQNKATAIRLNELFTSDEGYDLEKLKIYYSACIFNLLTLAKLYGYTWIHPSKIVPFPTRDLGEFDQEDKEHMANDILEKGFYFPVIIYPKGVIFRQHNSELIETIKKHEKYNISFGSHRLVALSNINWEKDILAIFTSKHCTYIDNKIVNRKRYPLQEPVKLFTYIKKFNNRVLDENISRLEITKRVSNDLYLCKAMDHITLYKSIHLLLMVTKKIVYSYFEDTGVTPVCILKYNKIFNNNTKWEQVFNNFSIN